MSPELCIETFNRKQSVVNLALTLLAINRIVSKIEIFVSLEPEGWRLIPLYVNFVRIRSSTILWVRNQAETSSWKFHYKISILLSVLSKQFFSRLFQTEMGFFLKVLCGFLVLSGHFHCFSMYKICIPLQHSDVGDVIVEMWGKWTSLKSVQGTPFDSLDYYVCAPDLSP